MIVILKYGNLKKKNNILNFYEKNKSNRKIK